MLAATPRDQLTKAADSLPWGQVNVNMHPMQNHGFSKDIVGKLKEVGEFKVEAEICPMANASRNGTDRA